MPSKEEKKRRAALVETMVGEHTKKAIEDMPLPLKELGDLFDYLDEKLGVHDCDHTPKLTVRFLDNHQLNSAKVLPWLEEQGGYCDCEILANVEESWESEIRNNI